MLEHTPVFGGGTDEKLVSASEGRKLASFADAVARWTLNLALLLFPLAYMPGLVDALELPKQTFLVVVTAVATLAWLGKMLVTRRLEIRRSVMHLFVATYFVIYAVSAWFSKSRYASFAGDFGQEMAALSTLACFILLYYVAVHVMREAKDVRASLNWLMLGGLLAIALSLLQAFGVHLLPGSASQAGSFNAVGTTNALGAYAAALLAMSMGFFLLPSKGGKLELVRKIMMGAIIALGAVYIAALQFWALWVMVVVASATLVAFGMIKTDRNMRVTMLAVPMAAIVIGILLMFVRFPVSLGLPAEVMPSMTASWNISREALARSSLLGSGPGTFLYNYTQFRSKDLNATSFWSVPFDRSASNLLTLLATTGILGFAAYLLMILFLAVRTKIKLWRGHEEWLTTLAVFAGWAALFAGRLVYSSNMTLEFAFWMLTAMLVALEWRTWSEAKFESSPRSALMLSFLFIVAVIFSVAGLYLQGQRLVAEARYSRGVTSQLAKPEDVDKAVADLLRATQLNDGSDLYFRSLSQALAVQANLEAQKAGDKPTTEQAQKITVLAANAVNAGKHAVDLNPANVQNWASLAGMYRDLGSAVPGAVDAAQQAYAKAQELDPNNPVYATELAKIHLTIAAEAAGSVNKDSKDEEKSTAQKTVDEHHAKAKELLDLAVGLKQDYAPAHYWLAVLLERQGKTAEAVAKLESVRNYNPKDLGVGFQLAILYYQNKQMDKAIAELERIIGLNSDYSNARWYLAAMYEEKGDLDKAIAQIEAVLAIPENKDNQEIAKRLEALKAKKSGAAAPAEEGLPEPVAGESAPAP
ncbi:MAG TPA: tetratricopeptide repeat protein [Patescibacteria group bacterium]|nr:tetratricopeptide repeat protein [Patescibacteria group bacterium]